MKILFLTAEQLVLLLEKKQLPTSLPLVKLETYAFIIQDFLYSLYQVIYTSPKFHYLRKNHFKPFRLIGSPNYIQQLLENHQKLLVFLKKENQIKKELWITLKKSGLPSGRPNYHFHFVSKLLPQLCLWHRIEQGTTPIEDLIQKIHTKTTDHHFEKINTLEPEGKKLFEIIFPPSLKTLLPLINHFVIHLSNDLNFPIKACYDGEKFPLIDSLSRFHRTSRSPLFRRKKNASSKIKSFLLLSSSEDSSMQEEKKSIQDVFALKKKFTQSFINLSLTWNKELCFQAIEKSDMVHFICHGKSQSNDFYLTHKQQRIIDLSNLEAIQKTPKVLFFSSCHSDQSELINWFFSTGGQSLIVSQGVLFSSNLSKAMKSFYWQLLFKKIPIQSAFQNLINRLAYLRDSSAFKLKLYGEGREKLSSF